MDINPIIQEAGQEMLQESLANTSQAFAAEETEEVTEVAPQPVDLWQQRRDAARDRNTPRVRGASPKVSLDMNDLFDRGIEQAYKKAIDDSELLRAEGDLQDAQIVEQQYMSDWFYPTVDALIRMNSMEEVLASQDVLAAFDNLVLGGGSGPKNGYTSVYIANLYEPVASQVFSSDAEVRKEIRRINQLCDDNQIRAAISVAQQLQQQIDMGSNRATPEDYEFVQRIALRGQ